MRKLFSLLVLFSLILFTGCTKDEVNPFGNIYGVVVNSNTSEPIQGARITLTPTGKSTVTGNDGSYEFVDLEAGTYKVTVQADGFASTLKNVTVVAGERAIGDVSVSPKGQNSKLGVDKDVVNFTKDIKTNTLYVKNLGNAGDINWEITGIPSWLEVSPVKGSTGIGKSSAVTLKLNSSFTGKADGSITINAAGESVSVIVLADDNAEGGDGGDPGDGGDNDKLQIETCDPDIELAIVSCKRSGNSVSFKYTIKNKRAKNIDFSIYGKFGGDRDSQLYDNTGRQYFSDDLTLKFNSQEASGVANNINTTLINNLAIPGEIIIKEASEGATKLSQIIIYVYSEDRFSLHNYIAFKNVPID